MASNEPKKRSIVATLVANMLTEREDDFTANDPFGSSLFSMLFAFISGFMFDN